MGLLLRKTHQRFHEEGPEQASTQNGEVGTQGDNLLWDQRDEKFEFSAGRRRLLQAWARELEGERSQKGEEVNCKTAALGGLGDRGQSWMPNEGSQPGYCATFTLKFLLHMGPLRALSRFAMDLWVSWMRAPHRHSKPGVSRTHTSGAGLKIWGSRCGV